jgi:ketosteroid isomerase-like protein
MGLLFQPRWPCDGFPIGDRAAGREEAPDRGRVFLLALEAVLLGDASHYGDVFTDDVEMRGPHLEVRSLASLQRAVGSPEDSLTDVAVTVADVLASGDRMAGEWRLDATFARPVLCGDGRLIEPTGGPVALSGASVAEFRGGRIRAFRHYFDVSELFTGVRGTPEHLRRSTDHRSW